jgi:hypothetical protein
MADRPETRTGQTTSTDPTTTPGNGARVRGVEVYDTDADTTTTATTTNRTTAVHDTPHRTTTTEPERGGTSWIGWVIGLIVLALILFFVFQWVF